MIQFSLYIAHSGRGGAIVNYFLKILGDTKMPGGDPLPFFERSESRFWEADSKILFSRIAAGMVCKGDILIQYVPVGLKNAEWAGRVVGCYRAVSHVQCKPYKESFGEWDYFCDVKNLTPKFALRAKSRTFVHIYELQIDIKNKMRSGILRLTREQGERAVAFIEGLEERTCR